MKKKKIHTPNPKRTFSNRLHHNRRIINPRLIHVQRQHTRHLIPIFASQCFPQQPQRHIVLLVQIVCHTHAPRPALHDRPLLVLSPTNICKPIRRENEEPFPPSARAAPVWSGRIIAVYTSSSPSMAITSAVDQPAVRDLGLCRDIGWRVIAPEELFPWRYIVEPWIEIIDYPARKCGGLLKRGVS